MHHLSICAGIGGIDLGLRRAIKDLRTVAMVEVEAFCIAHLVAKMEAGELDAAPIYPDLHRFPWAKYRGCVDIISGGFPCQPFSTAGSRKATEDPRHLWPVIKAGVALLRPSVVFFENVDGIVSAKSPGYHSVLHHVLSDLESLGFRATAGCYTAAEVGAPHLRRRWFILGVCDANSHSESDGTIDAKASGMCKSELADSRCDDAATRRQREAASQRCGERHGQSGSRCDAGPRHIEAARQVACMADSNHKRLERWQQFIGQSADKWPAGPGCAQRSNEPPRTTQPGVGGHADGIPNRVDRLRALGNAVVPDVAAKAFVELWHEVKEQYHGNDPR